MKPLNLILICIFLTSCLTVKRIEKNCDKFAQICVTETVVKTVYRDTTIFVDRIIKVPLPKDTVRLTDTVRVINDKCYLPMRHKKFGLVWVSAGVVNSVLNVTAGLTDSTILVPIHDTIFIKDAVSNTTTDNTVVLPPEKFIPKFYKFTFWVFIVLISGIVGYGVYWFKGGAIKNALNKLKQDN